MEVVYWQASKRLRSNLIVQSQSVQGSQDMTFPASWGWSKMQITDGFHALRPTGTARLLVKFSSLWDRAAMSRLPSGKDPWRVLIPEPCLGSVLGSCSWPEPKLCTDCMSNLTIQAVTGQCSGPCLDSGWLASVDESAVSEHPSQHVTFRCGEMRSWICISAHFVPALLACAHHAWRNIKTISATP